MINITTYILCFLAGLLGIAFHIFAIKIPGIRTRATVANMQFSFKAYFQDDLAAILTSLITLFIYLIVLKELTQYKPELKAFIVTFSVFVGFTGSTILITILGKAQDKINSIVDVKTNIADQVAPTQPPPPTV